MPGIYMSNGQCIKVAYLVLELSITTQSSSLLRDNNVKCEKNVQKLTELNKDLTQARLIGVISNDREL